MDYLGQAPQVTDRWAREPTCSRSKQNKVGRSLACLLHSFPASPPSWKHALFGGFGGKLIIKNPRVWNAVMSWIYFRVIQEGCSVGREEEEEAKLIKCSQLWNWMRSHRSSVYDLSTFVDVWSFPLWKGNGSQLDQDLSLHISERTWVPTQPLKYTPPHTPPPKEYFEHLWHAKSWLATRGNQTKLRHKSLSSSP